MTPYGGRSIRKQNLALKPDTLARLRGCEELLKGVGTKSVEEHFRVYVPYAKVPERITHDGILELALELLDHHLREV